MTDKLRRPIPLATRRFHLRLLLIDAQHDIAGLDDCTSACLPSRKPRFFTDDKGHHGNDLLAARQFDDDLGIDGAGNDLL